MALVDPEFWAGKRVFLTGHTGFKGSWMSQWLLHMGAKLRGFSSGLDWHQPPQGQKILFDELGLERRMDHITGDIRDLAQMAAVLRDFSPEIIIHMAAQPLVRRSYADPVETYAINVMGSVNLLTACRDLPDLRSIIVVTSDKCYENREQIWGYRETDAMGGHDPYSNSKGCTELLVSAFRNSYFHPEKYDTHGIVCASARAGNVIGGGDWCEDRLVPDIFRAIARGETLEIRNPNATRPWQHVLDPLCGYLRLAEISLTDPHLTAAGWNFGPAEHVTMSVGDIMGIFKSKLGECIQWEAKPQSGQLHEAQLLKLDCAAARERLGWHPMFSMPETLSMVTDWYVADSSEQRCQIVDAQIDRALSDVA